MAYTLTTATTEVRQLINEQNPGFWTDTEIENWLKMGCIDVSTKTQCVKHRDYFTLATDTQVYSPSDFNTNTSDILVRVQYAWYNDDMDAVTLQRIQPNQFGQVPTTSAGPPVYFFEDNQEIFVWPIPTSSENGNKVHILYSYATDDITNIRWHFQILPIWFAASMAKAKDEQFAQANLFQQMYLSALTFERKDKYEKGLETSQMKKVF